MDYLKKLMGSAYHDGITVEEINTFLASGKFVNLSEGKYVDIDKYNKAVSEKDSVQKSLDELKEKTKDYDSIKSENDVFKGEKADAELKTKLVGLGISEKSFKYVKGDINDKSLVIGDDEKANKEAVAKYLKDNPQFAAQPVVQSKVRVVSTKMEQTGNNDNNDNKVVNDNFRAALGVKTIVE